MIESIGKKSIKFSICIPTFNRAEYLRISIESALKQTYPHYEILVIDDGSIDDTEKIIQQYISDKLVYIRKEHSGAPSTRNIAIENATGDFLLWLADDDILLPGALSFYNIRLNKYPDVDIFYCHLKAFNDSDKSEYLITPREWYKSQKELVQFLITGCPIPDGGSIIRKKVYDEIGGYNPEFKRAHDYEFWTRVVQAGKFEFKLVDKVLYLYRLHSSNLTGLINENTDYRYESLIIKEIITKNKLEDLFPNAPWKENLQAALFDSYFFIAMKFFYMKDKESGTEFLLKAIQNKTLSENEMNYLGSVLIKSGFKEHEEINEVIKNSSSASFPEISHTNLLTEDKIALIEKFIEIKEYINALKIISEILKFEPENIILLNYLAVLQILKNDFKKAVDTLSGILEIDPNNEMALNNLIYIDQSLEV